MPTYRAQVVIPYNSGVPKDVITNTFHFIDFVPQPLNDLADDVTPLIQTLYGSLYAGTNMASNYVNWVGTTVNWYDLATPTPRVPYTLPMPISATSGVNYVPLEVACVSSFQANRSAGIPQARRRGRIYIGGLGSAWFTPSSSGNAPIFTSAKIGSVATAFDNFRTAVAGTSARWAVWSPTDSAAYLIDNGWVENDPDIQRRRGVTATLRTAWS